MNKYSIVVCLVLAILSQIACDANYKKEVIASQQVALVSDMPVNNHLVLDKKLSPDFIYDVGPRFNTIKKTDLAEAKTFAHFMDKELAQQIRSYNSMSVIILDGENKTSIIETSANGTLTPAQLKLLQTAAYSTNLLLKADFIENYPGTDKFGPNYASYYFTVIPEKQAVYHQGKDALISYLKVESESVRENVDPEKLQPAKLFFTVSKHGTIKNVYLDRPSGYPMVDKKMLELISKTQKSWIPAENSNGERVDQELVVSFGLLGC